MDMVKPTDNVMSTYPHGIFTSDNEWDPKILDEENNPSDFDADLLPLDLTDPTAESQSAGGDLEPTV
jgi:hypothetical protein